MVLYRHKTENVAVTRNKIRYIPLASDITELNSEILQCTYEGTRCLHRYIKTRENQPEICLNCLQEQNLLSTYNIIKKMV